MIETLMMVVICLGFLVVSLALAFSFAMNAYLDWQEQDVLIKHSISFLTERNSKGEADDNPID
jgi:hypothetical protein